MNLQLHLNIIGNILYGNYTNIINNNGSFYANHNYVLNLNSNNYNTEILVHNIGNSNFNMKNEYINFNGGKEGLKNSIVAVISKSLFSNMKQKAAIRNDYDIGEDSFIKINNNLFNVFNNSNYQKIFFDSYINRIVERSYNETDIIPYNFNNTIFNFSTSLYGKIMHDDNIIKNNVNKIFSGKNIIDNNITIFNISSNEEIINYSNTIYMCNLLISIQHND
jgi:hypothetical protein